MAKTNYGNNNDKIIGNIVRKNNEKNNGNIMGITMGKTLATLCFETCYGNQPGIGTFQEATTILGLNYLINNFTYFTTILGLNFK